MDRYRDQGKLPEVAHHHSELEALDTTAKYNPDAIHSDTVPTRRSQSRGTICGLHAVAYSVLLALIVAVIVGGAVGGGLSAQLSSCTKSQCTNTPTPTPTSTSTSTPSTTALLKDYIPVDALTIETLHNDCTGAPVSTDRGRFTTDCGVDYVGGFTAAEGGIVADIVGVKAYTFLDCIDACGELNLMSARFGSGLECRSVTWNLAFSNATRNQWANCWLKNGTIKFVGDLVVREYAMSAKLVV